MIHFSQQQKSMWIFLMVMFFNQVFYTWFFPLPGFRSVEAKFRQPGSSSKGANVRPSQGQRTEEEKLLPQQWEQPWRSGHHQQPLEELQLQKVREKYYSFFGNEHFPYMILKSGCEGKLSCKHHYGSGHFLHFSLWLNACTHDWPENNVLIRPVLVALKYTVYWTVLTLLH